MPSKQPYQSEIGNPNSMLIAILVLIFSLLLVFPFAADAEQSNGCPERIVSVNLGVDEILLDIADKDKIAGLTYLAVNEEISNVAEKAKQVRADVRSNLEQIIALKPDIVFVAKFTGADFIEQLKVSGTEVVTLRHFESFKDIKNNITVIGKEICEEKNAVTLVREMDRSLKEISETVSQVKEKPTVLYYNPWSFTAGDETIVGDMIELAGGINLAARAGIEGHKNISLEFVIEKNPDVIIVGSLNPSNSDFPKEVISNSVLKNVSAVKNDRVYVVSSKHLIASSHYAVQGVRDLLRLLHPNLVGKR